MSTPQINLYSFEQLENAARSDNAPADVLSAAWAEAEQVRETARHEGEAAGYAEGLARAQADAAPLVDALGAAIRSLESTRDEVVDGLVGQAAELALAVSEQILSKTLELQPEQVVEIARGALRRLADRQRVTVVVNPTDLELMAEQISRLQGELGGIEHLDVQADRRIDRGGAVARTAHGEIDATISAQLLSVRELVTAALQGEGAATESDAGDDD